MNGWKFGKNGLISWINKQKKGKVEMETKQNKFKDLTEFMEWVLKQGLEITSMEAKEENSWEVYLNKNDKTIVGKLVDNFKIENNVEIPDGFVWEEIRNK